MALGEDSKFDAMMEILREQNQYLRIVASRLEPVSPPHDPPSNLYSSPSPSIVETESGSRPILRREWDDDLGWSAVMQTALKRIRDLVSGWKENLDTTLLFIALFSAIVTAFLLPIIQNLTPVPGQDTDALLASLIDVIVQIASMNGLSVPDVKPPLPFQAAASDEISAFFWYSSLIVSVLCAGLAAFARFQMLDIEEEPQGGKFMGKVLRLRDRENTAKWLLNPTLGSLHWFLLVAIGLFLSGLLYQLWNVHSQTMGSLLLAAGILGTGLAGILCLFIAGVTIHAMLFEESLFDTSLSRRMRALIWRKGDIRSFLNVWKNAKDPALSFRQNLSCLWPLRDEFTAYSDPELSEAALHYCQLASGCTDPTLWNRIAPVLVECFPLFNDGLENINMDTQGLTASIQSALMSSLDPETSDEAKLTILNNVSRLEKAVMDECKTLTSMLSRVLLRLQEENAERNDATVRIRETAFRAHMHVIEAPSEVAEATAPDGTHHRTIEDCIVVGLRSCDPIDSKALVSPPFLAALFEWDRLPEEGRHDVLMRLDAASFLGAYVTTIYWAYKDLSQWSHRAYYRAILKDKVRPLLDDIIQQYDHRAHGQYLLNKLAPFISNLDERLDIDTDGPGSSRVSETTAAMIGILRRIKELHSHYIERRDDTEPPLPISFDALELMFNSIDPKTYLRQVHPPENPEKDDRDADSTPKWKEHREVLQSYKEKFGGVGSLPHQGSSSQGDPGSQFSTLLPTAYIRKTPQRKASSSSYFSEWTGTTAAGTPASPAKSEFSTTDDEERSPPHSPSFGRSRFFRTRTISRLRLGLESVDDTEQPPVSAPFNA